MIDSRTSLSKGAGGTRPSVIGGRVRVWAGIACTITIALALGACEASPKAPAESTIVESTVVRYNRLLAEGYRAMDMTRMRDVADELQAEDEYIHMAAMGEGGVRLLPILKELEFLEMSIEDTAAYVETRERWDYSHEDRRTREVVLIQRDLIYELAWDLAKGEDGRWLVTDVRAVEATTTVPPERLGMPSPGIESF